MNIQDKTILITGGTGSFGRALIRLIQQKGGCKKIIVFSRDEYKQWMMQQEDPLFAQDNMRYFLGDVRDLSRLQRALDGVDLVVHAAALKQVPAAEYNPTESIKTNVLGAMNLIEAALDKNVQKVIALSTDKAVSPINLYGATKLCADKLFVAANSYSGQQGACFSVVRYGNVFASRGSIISQWKERIDQGNFQLPITDTEMTRFWITIEHAAEFVYQTLANQMKGGEIFIPKMPSMKLVDLAYALCPNPEFDVIGIRPGEKIHEQLISEDDARSAFEYEDHFVIAPEIFKGKTTLTENSYIEEGVPVATGFSYASNTNSWVLHPEEIQEFLHRLEEPSVASV